MHYVSLFFSSVFMVIAAFAGLVVWEFVGALVSRQGPGATGVRVMYVMLAEHSLIAGTLLLVVFFIFFRLARA